MLDIFTEADWQRIRSAYEGWWTRTLERPIINLSFYGAETKMSRPEGLITSELFKYPPEESADKIAEKLEYIMRTQRYEYDGYPYVWMYLGPIWSVECLGARAHVMDNTVWYKPDSVPDDIADMHMRVAPDSVFLPRAKAIGEACDRRFGNGYVGNAEFGGPSNLDYVSEFYGPMELSYLLYDEPDEILRLCRECNQATHEVADILRPTMGSARGYTTWGGIYAPEHWLGMQCDFSAMIGPAHFEKFVLWDLERGANESPKYNYYHLDGPGELPHLDAILSIKNLKCIQWVPGAGAAPESEWPEVYKKISDAGKNMWVTGEIENVDAIARQIGTTRGIYWSGSYPMSEYDRVMKIAERLVNK